MKVVTDLLQVDSYIDRINALEGLMELCEN